MILQCDRLMSALALLAAFGSLAPSFAAEPPNPFASVAELQQGCKFGDPAERANCRTAVAKYDRVERTALEACTNGIPYYLLDCAQILNGRWVTPEVRRFCGANRERPDHCFATFRDGVFDSRLMQICADYGRSEAGYFEARCVEMIRGKLVEPENRDRLLQCFAPGQGGDLLRVVRADRLNCVAIAMMYSKTYTRYPGGWPPLPNMPVP